VSPTAMMPCEPASMSSIESSQTIGRRITVRERTTLAELARFRDRASWAAVLGLLVHGVCTNCSYPVDEYEVHGRRLRELEARCEMENL
jgi:hypothetical protein